MVKRIMEYSGFLDIGPFRGQGKVIYLMITRGTILIWLCSSLFLGAAEFDELVQALGSETHAERESSHAALAELAQKRFADLEGQLLGALFEVEDPESRGRLEVIVHDAAIHHYLVRTNRGFIGITLYTQTFTDAEKMKVPAVRVVTIYPETPAQAAGLRTNDMIVAVDGMRIESWMTNQDFIDYITAKNPGTAIELDIPRAGKLETVEVVLGRKTGAMLAAEKARSAYYRVSRDPEVWFTSWIRAQRLRFQRKRHP